MIFNLGDHAGNSCNLMPFKIYSCVLCHIPSYYIFLPYFHFIVLSSFLLSKNINYIIFICFSYLFYKCYIILTKSWTMSWEASRVSELPVPASHYRTLAGVCLGISYTCKSEHWVSRQLPFLLFILKLCIIYKTREQIMMVSIWNSFLGNINKSLFLAKI